VVDSVGDECFPLQNLMLMVMRITGVDRRIWYLVSLLKPTADDSLIGGAFTFRSVKVFATGVLVIKCGDRWKYDCCEDSDLPTRHGSSGKSRSVGLGIG
jgi:hypothetical protein